jgi:hypothetical protein
MPPVCVPSPETFWTLLHDMAHWEFEIFLMIIFDGVLGGLVTYLIWPKIKEHWAHHKARDKQDGV